MDLTTDLKGLHVIVTRPARQAAPLCALIRAAGGEPLLLPAMEILPPENPGPARALLTRLAGFDIALFISANAVEQAAPLIAAQGGMPPTLRLGAVGQRTAAALRQHFGRADIEAPPPYNSEALLSAAALRDVNGKRILIVRGAGGREFLADSLRARGAAVDYAEVYRRAEPRHGLDAVLKLQQSAALAAIIVTSNEGLQNLMNMAGETHRAWLLNTQLVVISPRSAELARELGFRRAALVAARASDEALVEVIAGWRRQTQAC